MERQIVQLHLPMNFHTLNWNSTVKKEAQKRDAPWEAEQNILQRKAAVVSRDRRQNRSSMQQQWVSTVASGKIIPKEH